MRKRWCRAMPAKPCSTPLTRVVSRAASRPLMAAIAALFVTSCSVLEPFETAPDPLPDGSIADVHTARDSSSGFSDRSSFSDVGRDAARDGTGGNAEGSSGAGGSGGTAGTGAGGTGTGGGGGGAGGASGGSGGATGGSGGASGGSAGAGGASTGGAGGATGGSGGAGGVAGSARTGGAGGSGALVVVQGHIGTIGMITSPIGNIRVMHPRISTPSSRLCSGTICVTGGLTP
jgi:hypothetical protein